MFFNPSCVILLTKHSVKPLNSVPEETENADETDGNLTPLLMEHGLACADASCMSVSTYHTHTQTTAKPLDVRKNIVHVQ